MTEQPGTAEHGTPTLVATGLSKAFGHVQALNDVSFEAKAGEVLAIMGDNGAGKSTLVKIIAGVYKPDSGELAVDGVAQRFRHPMDAAGAGIATVYQDLALVESRDVAQNLYLGRELRWGPFVDRRRCNEGAQRIIDQLGVKLPSVRVPVALLSGGQRQAVAVARTLVYGAHIVVLDEPTAALGVTESKRVLNLVDRLRRENRAVILVSHNLQQVWEVADRFMVMRLGEVAGIRTHAQSSVEEIVHLIVYGSSTNGAAVRRA
jgi:ABC-type sugar transport system ATPase subunit